MVLGRLLQPFPGLLIPLKFNLIRTFQPASEPTPDIIVAHPK